MQNTDGIDIMCDLRCLYMMIRVERFVVTISFLPACWCVMMQTARSTFMIYWQ